MSIRILLLGSGGREHALAWKLSKSQLLDRLFVCPGNGGTAQEPKTINVDLSPTHFPGLVEFSLKNKVYSVSRKLIRALSGVQQVDLVVPGPEQPLVDGIESHFRKGTFTKNQIAWR